MTVLLKRIKNWLKIFDFSISFKKKWFKKRRKEIRFYNSLNASKSLGFINKLLCEVRVAGPSDGYSCLGLRCSAINVNQFLAHRFQTGSIGRRWFTVSTWHAYQTSEKKIAFPVPTIWWSTLREHGLIVAPLRSFLYWKLFASILFIHSFFKILKVSIKNTLVPVKSPMANFTLLSGLNDGHLPDTLNGINSYTIIDWFMRYRGSSSFVINGKFRSKNVNKLRNITIWNDPLGSLPFSKAFILFTFSVLLLIRCLGNLIFGDGFKAIMFYELWLFKKSQLCESKNLAKEYAFSNSDFIYKPLWVETVEKNGSSVVLYFYSLNCMPYIVDDQPYSTYFGYKNLTWPKYLVWNEKFGSFLKPLMVNPGVIELVPPIFFTNNYIEDLNVRNKIIIFDISPLRTPLRLNNGDEAEYFNDDTSDLFFKNFPVLAKKYGINFIIKQKRSKRNPTSSRYTNLILGLGNDPRIEVIDADISAHQLLQDCLGVISMPFTSTAHIAFENAIPSIYYDPTARLQKDQPAALGIDLISSMEELETWMRDIMSKKK